MDINGSTRTIGLIGNPVEHTLSPVIHNGLSEAMGISSVYVPWKVEADGLEDAIHGAYELNILGMNVTVPHKNAVMEYLADIDDAARNIGSVNTLVRDDGKHGYIGYNTDMPGLRRQIHEDGISLSGKTVVILGAGGASKAVVYMCLIEGAGKIYLVNRTIGKAGKIAEDMNRLVKSGALLQSEQHSFLNETNKGVYTEYDRVVPISLSEYNTISENDLIVFQATSIGLFPNVNDVVIDDPSFYEKIDTGIDLIYNPAETMFMKLVKAHGGIAYNALKMLLYQGVIAYELWHNVKVPDEIVEDMYVELKRQVYKKDNIVLIGFMGSGKTTFGKELAKVRHMDFVDTDEFIEARAGMSIAEIFAVKGEDEFRRIETETLKELRNQLSNTVLSTGGGMPLRRENALLLKDIGKVLYLNAATQVIYDRVKDDTGRPLLQGTNPYDKICTMMKERRPLYERACDIIVDANSNDLDEALYNIQKVI